MRFGRKKHPKFNVETALQRFHEEGLNPALGATQVVALAVEDATAMSRQWDEVGPLGGAGSMPGRGVDTITSEAQVTVEACHERMITEAGPSEDELRELKANLIPDATERLGRARVEREQVGRRRQRNQGIIRALEASKGKLDLAHRRLSTSFYRILIGVFLLAGVR